MGVSSHTFVIHKLTSFLHGYNKRYITQEKYGLGNGKVCKRKQNSKGEEGTCAWATLTALAIREQLEGKPNKCSSNM